MRAPVVAGITALVLVVGAGAAVGVVALTDDDVTAASGVDASTDVGLDEEGEGVAPTMPVTPDVPTLEGALDGDVRTFELTASEFGQKLANFPVETAKVWGYNGSTPGPTLVLNEGETMKAIIKNDLPPTDPKGDMPPGPHPTSTTVHWHGLHQPNDQDGVAGISQPEPIAAGATYTYTIKPRHAGTFAYHSHTDGAVQDLRGLEGMIVVLPPSEDPETKPDVDVVMTVQQFAPIVDMKLTNGVLVDPFPPGSFPINTINGKTGDAAGGPITVKEGDRVRMRLYNGSQNAHSMHLHGHDFTVTSQNGHPVAPEDRNEVTTEELLPGDFFEAEWVADNPGNWIFHCHFPHHTTNAQLPGYNGSPVGMLRIFHYEGYEPVPPEYFTYQGPSA